MICPNCGSKMFESFRTWKCSKDCNKQSNKADVSQEVIDFLIKQGIDIQYIIPGATFSFLDDFYQVNHRFSTGALLSLGYYGPIWGVCGIPEKAQAIVVEPPTEANGKVLIVKLLPMKDCIGEKK